MKKEEVFEIIKRVRNGEKAEDIIDFTQPTRSGEITPTEVFSLAINNIFCQECGKKLQGEEMFFCGDCIKKSQEDFSQGAFGIKYDEKDKWTWLIGLMMVAGIFSNGDKKE